MAAEVRDPKRTLPLAVFGTIGSVTIVYVLASISLAGLMYVP